MKSLKITKKNNILMTKEQVKLRISFHFLNNHHNNNLVIVKINKKD